MHMAASNKWNFSFFFRFLEKIKKKDFFSGSKEIMYLKMRNNLTYKDKFFCQCIILMTPGIAEKILKKF